MIRRRDVVVGLDLGGTKITAMALPVLDDAREPLHPTSLDPIRRRTPSGTDQILGSLVEMAREAAGKAAVRAVALGAAGSFDAEGTVTYATDILPGWTGTPVAGVLARALQAPVRVVNDVHAAAYAEAHLGRGTQDRCVLMASVGTGVGGGCVMDGELMTGASGRAMALGHIPVAAGTARCSCGETGHVEAHASGPSMELAFAQGGRRRPLEDVAALAQAGDADARRVISAGARAMGEALAVASAVVDPDLIVIGGGVAEIGEPFLAPLREAYALRAQVRGRTARVEPALFGQHSTLMGAIGLARELVARS